MKKLIILFMAMLMILTIGLPGYADDDLKLKELGLVTGFGKASIPEGTYETVPIILHMGIDMARYFPSLKRHKGLLTGIIEPQVNMNINPDNDLEFGVGAGMQYQYPVTKYFSPYMLATFGPHYITVDTTTQAQGLVTCTYVGGGVYLYVNDHIAFNLGYRWRHLSNADTRKPNGSINDHFGVIGISLFF